MALEFFVLVAVVLFLTAAFGWPTWRSWRRHQVWPIVFAREAAPAQRLFGGLTFLLFALVLGTSALAALLGPAALGVAASPAPARLAGGAFMVAGFGLTVAAQGAMGASWRVGIDDRPTALVLGGPFRWVRNPIYTGVLLSLAGYACLLPAWWSVALWLAAAIAIRGQIALEERHLIAMHGAAYLEYASRVGRLVPLLGRLRPPA